MQKVEASFCLLIGDCFSVFLNIGNNRQANGLSLERKWASNLHAEDKSFSLVRFAGWERLSADGGETGRCGWLKDKFGLSWQVGLRVLGEMLADKDKAKAERVMSAMMEMDKIDIEKLKAAAANR